MPQYSATRIFSQEFKIKNRNNILNEFRICPYNCNSIRKHIVRSKKICDVICLQEVFIFFNEDSDFMHISFDALVWPGQYSVSESFEGHPSGGMAYIYILCRHGNDCTSSQLFVEGI